MFLRNFLRGVVRMGALIGLLGVAGGCEDRESPLGVRGSVTITSGATRSGFSFPTETLLYGEATAPPGATWGYCDIRIQGQGRPDIIAVGVAQGSAGDGGVASDRMFRARFDDPRPASLRAYAEVVVSGRLVRANPADACSLEVTAYDVQSRVAQVRSNCTVTNEGETVQIVADLTFARCFVQGT